MEVGIPSPEALAVGKENDRAFLLENRVPGVNGAYSTLPRETLYRTLGAYARCIHARQTGGFGDSVTAFEGGGTNEGWQATIRYHLASLTAEDPLIALGVYSANHQDAIREAFTRLFRLPLRIGLNHGDLSPANTVVDETGRVTLLDWGCAGMQVVPHYEFDTFLRRHDADAPSLAAFREGYGITDRQWADLQPEIVLFSLLKAFDLTRWAIDRCPNRIPELAARARRHWDAYREHGTTPDQSPDVPTK